MRKLLIANRGEIARRIARTARAMGIATVAVHSDADAASPHVAEADEAVHLPGVTATETYLDVEALLRAARLTGADAVHPGYGFLSENAAFARACEATGLTFVGPPAEVIEAMGSKLSAKRTLAAAGIPVLGEEGWPKLVKASAGGGGRGMRIAHDEAELAAALQEAAQEARSAFGDGTVFVERLVEHPRHVEVQVFGDTHGNVVHLFERECSIQRRYQKVIEEAPSPAVDERLRRTLGDTAVTAARALGYVGAGTVEFVLEPSGDFWFLEVNTRLQVEHPVTEMVTGLDLVELQLRVARGERLPEAAMAPPLEGHAVEARLYAEDVPAGYLPTGGPVHRLRFSPIGRVRVDSGYEDGSVVSTHYDGLLAKVIAWAPTRTEAVSRLVSALAGAEIHGPPTNRDLLVNVLRHPDFLEGRIDTGFLDRHDCSAPLVSGAELRVHALAAALARQAENRAGHTIWSGWRNVPTALQRVTYQEAAVGYRFERGGLVAEVDGRPLHVRLWSAAPELVDLSVGGVRRRLRVHRTDAVTYVDGPSGASTLHEVDRFPLPEATVDPGSLLAPLPGSVVQVLVEPGQQVRSGEVLVVLEAMKMQHQVVSPADGAVADLRVSVGDQVDTGQVLALVDPNG